MILVWDTTVQPRWCNLKTTYPNFVEFLEFLISIEHLLHYVSDISFSQGVGEYFHSICWLQLSRWFSRTSNKLLALVLPSFFLLHIATNPMCASNCRSLHRPWKVITHTFALRRPLSTRVTAMVSHSILLPCCDLPQNRAHLKDVVYWIIMHSI